LWLGNLRYIQMKFKRGLRWISKEIWDRKSHRGIWGRPKWNSRGDLLWTCVLQTLDNLKHKNYTRVHALPTSNLNVCNVLLVS
jgi:hypothetical protein